MKKTRVPKGEKYYFINNLFEVVSDFECGTNTDNIRFDTDNYFHSEEFTEFIARKLRAVLKGAEVYTFEEITEIKANAFADGMEAERRKINREVI